MRDKYHKIGYIREVEVPLTGLTLNAEEKRCGTCLIVNSEGVFSRNQKAAKAFVESFERAEKASNVKKAVEDLPMFTFFLELLQKGKSPTRVELHEVDSIVLFDIWDNQEEKWLDRGQKELLCLNYDIPIVEKYASFVYDEKTFHALEVEFLAKAKAESREGVVFKNESEHVYFKSKWERPRLVKIPKPTDPRPQIPESEIFGAVSKAEADLGEDFLKKEKAMPLIAQYVREECKKHGFSGMGNLFHYYCAYLDRNMGKKT